MKTTAVVNQKGGVGKTATSTGTAGALADLGRRVLLVDFDPQGHLTKALKVTAPDGPDLATALLGGADVEPLELVVPHSAPGDDGVLAVIPHTVGMFSIVRELDKLRSREHRLARVLAPLKDAFDHVIIDCPPALDILTDNALVAADGVLVPVQAEDSSLHALELLLAQVDAIESEVRGSPLVLHGLVVSMLERGPGGLARSTIGRSVVESFEALEGIPVLASVPRGVPVTEAWRYGKTVTDYAPKSEHAAAYRALAKVLDAA